jgi:hypothetical protein
VVSRVPVRRRRVVLDVAIEIVERSGCGVSNVHGSRHRAVSRGSAGDCGPTVAAVRFSPLVAITERTQGTAIPEAEDIWGNWDQKVRISQIGDYMGVRFEG